MTNNYSTIKDNNYSKKILLVRINPARSILYSLSLVSGFTYQAVVTFSSVNKLEVNGVAYTKVVGTPLVNQFSFDESTKTILVTLPQLLINYMTDGNIVIYYYLFYTNEIYRVINEDPEDSNTALRYWEPRLLGSPTFEVNQEDIIDNFLTIGNTSIELKNEDSDFQNYITSKDSFANKEIKIWHCLDAFENIQKLFFGYTNAITIGKNIQISLDNGFSKFNNNYYSNQTLIKSILNVTDYPNVINENMDIPIYNIYSKSSYTKQIGIYSNSQIVASANSLNLYYIFENGYELKNISYNFVASNLVNRTWVACVASTVNSNITVIAANVSTIQLNTLYEIDVVDSDYFRPNDNVLLNGNYKYFVWSIVSSTRIQICTVAGTGGTTINNGDVIIRPSISMIQIFDHDDSNKVHILVYARDYTINTDSNGVYNIVFSNNLETNFPDLGVGLHPETRIIYRSHNHDDLLHGTIIKNILIGSGLDTFNSEFNLANLTDLKVNFSIPYFGETDFKTTKEYLQNILTSTFGHLDINNYFQVGYNLIRTIIPSNDITDYDIVKDSLNQSIDYSNIIDVLFFENLHGDILEYFIGWIGVGTFTKMNNSRETRIDIPQNRYLHGINKSKTINYVLQNMTNSKDRIKNILSTQRVNVEFITKGKNFSSILGDNFNIISDDISTGQAKIKILGLTKDIYTTKVRAIDLFSL